MAYSPKWRFSFANIMEETLTVTILAEGYEGEVATLTPSATPFVTDESDDSEILIPSRISTGYINVINCNDLDGLMPEGNLQHMVQLTKGTTVLWVGFMQAQSFGRDMYLEGEEVQFAVTDWLGAMENLKMDVPSIFSAKMFSEYIAEIIEKYDIVTRIYVPSFRHSDNKDVRHWFSLSVNQRNFFTPNEAENTQDADYEPYERISYLQLLEEIAKTVGWTVMMNGTELWFMDFKENATYYYITRGDFISDKSNPSHFLLKLGYVGWEALEELPHGDTDNTVVTIKGYKEIKVVADPNATEAPSSSMNVSGMPFVRTKTYRHSGRILRSHIYRNNNPNLTLYGYTAEPSSSSVDQAIMTEVAYDPDREVSPESRDMGNDFYSGYIIPNAVRGDYYNSTDEKKSYRYRDGVTIDYRYSYYSQAPDLAHNNGYVFKMNNVKLFTYNAGSLPLVDNGCIIINFAVEVEVPAAVSTFLIPVKLRVGNKFWNGSGWQSAETTFNLQIENNAVKNNKTLDLDYDNAESGYLAPITSNMSGDMELTVYSCEDLFWYNYSSMDERHARFVSYDGGIQMFSGIEIRYANKSEDSIIDKRDTAEFIAMGNAVFDETKEVELCMSTEITRLNNGYGTLAIGNNVLKPGEFVVNGKDTLEEILLDKMRDAYLRPSVQAKPVLRLSTSDIPKCGSMVTWGEDIFQLMARSIDWRECNVKPLLIQLPNGNENQRT